MATPLDSPTQRAISGDRPAGFSKFNDLPPELRIKIWQHAMPDGRTIVISPPAQDDEEPFCRSLDDALASSQPEDESVERTWRSHTSIPALIHVNAEARHEALKHYTLALGSSPRTYVDFERDTLFFGHDTIKPSCRRLWAATKDLNHVKHLAVVP